MALARARGVLENKEAGLPGPVTSVLGTIASVELKMVLGKMAAAVPGSPDPDPRHEMILHHTPDFITVQPMQDGVTESFWISYNPWWPGKGVHRLHVGEQELADTLETVLDT